jgi:hypothetical protein
MLAASTSSAGRFLSPMRYYQNSRSMRKLSIALYAFNSALFLSDAIYHPTRWSILIGIVWPLMLLSSIFEPHWMYWEVADDRIKHRHFWRYSETLYGEIVSVKPAIGWLSDWTSSKPIEIRTVAGTKLKPYLSKSKEFLAELHNHVPTEAFFFDEAQA